MIDEFMGAVKLFTFSEHRPLSNIFAQSSKLDELSIHDLLNFSKIGTSRIIEYVKQNLLIPPKEATSDQKRERKLHTFTPRPPSTHDNRSKVKQLCNLVQNAIEVLQASGITAQASPYPLAIAQIDGAMRMGTKSEFKCASTASASSSLSSFWCALLTFLVFVSPHDLRSRCAWLWPHFTIYPYNPP